MSGFWLPLCDSDSTLTIDNTREWIRNNANVWIEQTRYMILQSPGFYQIVLEDKYLTIIDDEDQSTTYQYNDPCFPEIMLPLLNANNND